MILSSPSTNISSSSENPAVSFWCWLGIPDVNRLVVLVSKWRQTSPQRKPRTENCFSTANILINSSNKPTDLFSLLFKDGIEAQKSVANKTPTRWSYIYIFICVVFYLVYEIDILKKLTRSLEAKSPPTTEITTSLTRWLQVDE